jgi:hypothetical protein
MNGHAAGWLSILSLGILATSLPAQRPPNLQTADFAAGRIHLDADSSAVIQVLGHPDSARTGPLEDWDPNVLFDFWYFHGVMVSFRPSNAVEGIVLTSPVLRTPRGLRVGDGRARVRQLYGLPSPASDKHIWYYGDFSRASRLGPRLILVYFAGDKVSRIDIRYTRA